MNNCSRITYGQRNGVDNCMKPAKFRSNDRTASKTEIKTYYTVYKHGKQPTERWKHTTGKTHAKTVEMIAERESGRTDTLCLIDCMLWYSRVESRCVLCTFARSSIQAYRVCMFIAYIHAYERLHTQRARERERESE